MSYTVVNFKTKKTVKEAVKAYLELANKNSNLYNDKAVYCYNPGLGPDLSNYTGSVALEGPHYPKAHTWYAEGKMVNGILVSVK